MDENEGIVVLFRGFQAFRVATHSQQKINRTFEDHSNRISIPMALIKFHPTISHIRGKLGSGPDDPIAYEVDGRTFIRSSGKVEDPQTPLQLTYRAIMKRVASAYKNLTYEQATSWQNCTKSLQQRESPLYQPPRRFYGAFQQVNIHRLVIGQAILYEAPEAEAIHVPSTPPQIEWVAPQQLRVRFRHAYHSNETWWRIHVSPPLATAFAKAKKNEIRSTSDDPSQSYYIGQEVTQDILIDTKENYSAGDNIGIEILGLSSDFVPGERIVHRRLEVVA